MGKEELKKEGINERKSSKGQDNRSYKNWELSFRNCLKIFVGIGMFLCVMCFSQPISVGGTRSGVNRVLGES